MGEGRIGDEGGVVDDGELGEEPGQAYDDQEAVGLEVVALELVEVGEEGLLKGGHVGQAEHALLYKDEIVLIIVRI